MGAAPSTLPSTPVAAGGTTDASKFSPYRDKFEAKDEARNDRLRSSNTVKNRIWSEWQKQCLKKCDTDVKRFWVCREENGLLSPFRCTAENEAMKLALQTCGRDEVGFAAFRAKRVDEIERDILARAALRELKAAEGSKG